MTVTSLTAQIVAGANAYDPQLYLARAQAYLELGYPDLAAGDAYRAVLLTDYVRDYSEEGELKLEELSQFAQGNPDGGVAEDEEEYSNFEEFQEEEGEEERSDFEEFQAATHALSHLRAAASPAALLTTLEAKSLHLLSESLRRVGCVTAATTYTRLGIQRFPGSRLFPPLLPPPPSTSGGRARRLVYPWNTHEPDRFSDATVRYLNTHVIPKSSSNTEVRVVQLPLLGEETAEVLGFTRHLGVFAKQDIAVGEPCLQEESALTVVTDPAGGGLCEYCGTPWRREYRSLQPPLPSAAPKGEESGDLERETYTCDLCADAEASGIEAVVPVWCSRHCRDAAMGAYHPALCSRPIAPLHRAALSPPPPTESSQPGGTVYSLLLLKTFAMALTQGTHPLELDETKFLYGVPPIEEADLRIGWGWEENVRGVLGILEALGIDVFTGRHRTLASTQSSLQWWDTWVVNTLIAKFRGVASGRLNLKGQTEAAAVHTIYSLVNHDCEPTVRWECAGIMRFWGVGKEGEVAVEKGRELFSCYCDKRLGYKERREWMMGCLGGKCMCKRCLREEREEREERG